MPTWQSVNTLLDHEEPAQHKVWDRHDLDEHLRSESHILGQEHVSRTRRIREMAKAGFSLREIAASFHMAREEVERITERRRK